MKEINLDKEIEQAQKLLDELLERKSKQRSEIQSDLVDQINSLAEKLGLNEQFSLKVINRTALYHGEAYPKVSMIKLISSVTGNVYQTFDVEDYSAEETIALVENALDRNLDRYKLIERLIESNLEVESINHKPQYTRLNLRDGRTVNLNFSLSRESVEISASEQIAADKDEISFSLDDDMSLVIANDNRWSSVDLYAKIESKPIKCDLTFDSVKSTVDQSLSLLDKTSDKYATYFTFA